MSHINKRKEWVTQITDSYEKWISTAAVSKLFPHSMLTLNDQTSSSPGFCWSYWFPRYNFQSIWGSHLSWPSQLHNPSDKPVTQIWTRSGNTWRGLETYMILDNYFRSISGLPPAPYPECQPSQMALEQNSPDYLTSLANLEVNSILRTLEKPDMYMSMETLHQVSWSLEHPWQMNMRRAHPQKRKTTPLQDLGLSPGLHPWEQCTRVTPGYTLLRHGTIGNTSYPRMDNSSTNPCEHCGSAPAVKQV